MDELISKRQAIDALRGYLVGKRCPDDGTLTCRLIENEVINKLPSALGTNLAEVGTDSISRQSAIDAFNTNLNELVVGGEENAKTVENYLNRVLDKIKCLPSAQPEIIRCKDCKYADYMDDVKAFWCSEGGRGKTVALDDFCSYAERREVTT